MTDHVRTGPKPEGRCEIVWFSVPEGPPYYANGPARAVAQCMTHQWPNVPGVMMHVPGLNLCPIGRIEAATEAALEKIKEATEAKR